MMMGFAVIGIFLVADLLPDRSGTQAAAALVKTHAPAVAPAETRPSAEGGKQKGFLQIEAIPFGELFINNKKFDAIAGARRIALAPGTYGLRFEHPKQVKSETITLKAGQTVAVKFHPLK